LKAFKTLIRLYLKDMIRRRDRKQAATFIVLGSLYLIIMILAIISIISMGEIIKESGSVVQVLTAILFFDFTLTVITGTVSAISFLFLSKDNEFFASLPIKPGTIFMAKFTILLMTELLISLAIILPTFLVLGIVVGLNPLFYFMIPVAIISVPVFATVVIALISMPIVWLSTKFKNRGLLKTIIALIVFVGFFALYFIIINMVTAEAGDIDFSALSITSYIIYPLFMLMNFATRTPVFSLSLTYSMLVSFMTFIVPIIVFLMFSYLLSRSVYQKIIRNSLESKGNVVNKSGRFVSGSIKGAIMRKEWRMIIRDTAVAVNTIAMILLAPIIVIFSVVGAGAGFSDFGAETAKLIEWSMGIIIMMMMTIGLNGAGSCISREGPQFYYMKMLPVSYKDQIKAKQNFYNIISIVAIILSLLSLVIFTLIRGTFIWWVPILIMIGAIVWSIAVTNLSIYFDLRNPKLDWRNIKEVVKRLKNQVVYLVWMIFALFVFGGMLGGVAVSEALGINAEIFMMVYLAVFALIGFIAAFLFNMLLHKSIKNLFSAQ